MLSPNVKPSLGYPVAGKVPPQSLAAAASANTGWIQIPMDSKWAMVQLLTGVLGGGSEQVDLQQATDAVGTGAKALQTAAIIDAVNNDTQDYEANLDMLLDFANNFSYIRALVTNTGGTGALVSLALRFGPTALLG
jgi:hypothetical protein